MLVILLAYFLSEAFNYVKKIIKFFDFNDWFEIV